MRVQVLTRGVGFSLLALAVGLVFADSDPWSRLRYPNSGDGFAGYGRTIAFRGRSRVLTVCTSAGSLLVWEPQASRFGRTSCGADGTRENVAFSADGLVLASTDRSGLVSLYDTATGQRKGSLNEQILSLNAIAFSRDRRLLATADNNGIRFWDVDSGRPEASPAIHRPDITSLAFAPDGLTLAGGSWNGMLRLWTVPTGRRRLAFRAHERMVSSLVFTHDGHALASACSSSPIGRLWNMREGGMLAQFNARSEIQSLAMKPGGQVLATAGRDGRLRLWNTITGRLNRTLSGPLGPATALAFSADGQALACCGFGSLVYYHLDDGTPRSTP